MATDEFTIGVDIGGTFTDCVVIDPTGAIGVGKVPTRPDDRAGSFFESIEEAAGRFGLTLDEILGRTGKLVHGTTTGTNALLTRTGADVGLLTTVGHRDSTHMMNGAGRLSGTPPDLVLDLPNTDKPVPLVPKRLIREVQERVDHAGTALLELDETSVRDAYAQLRADGANAVAVALLWSIRNGRHEERIAEIIAEEDAEMFVSCSSQLSPRLGELERTMTTVINSYIGPLMNRYVQEIEDGARRHGYGGRVLYAQCAGGAITAEEAQSAPVRTVHSGPVSGTLGSAFLARRMGEENLIVTDMGGTSFDVSVVRDQQPDVREVAEIERFGVAMPMVFVDTIGAGGGSIAWVDEAGRLNVGPQSAGAFPGPACYGNGGTEPTVTDADLVLGVLDPETFLHGRMHLDRDAAEKAVGTIADAMGMDLYEAAAGIVRIIDSKMSDLLRRMSVLRGLDPREFVCFAYGGGGPVHAAAVARDVGVKRLIVPLLHVAPVWSAFGASIAPVSHVHQRWETHKLPVDPVAVNTIFDALELEAHETLSAEGFPASTHTLTRSLRCKYNAQFYDVEVSVPEGPLAIGELEKIQRDFERNYDELHGEGAGYREGGAQITSFTVRASVRTEEPQIAAQSLSVDARWTERSVFWSETGSFAPTRVLSMSNGVLDERLRGPMLVELPDTVVVIRPGQTAEFDALGSLVINVAGDDVP